MKDPHLIHVTGPMERWDHIAYRYYGNASAYSRIIAANRELFPAAETPIPQFLAPGTELKIPVITVDPAPRPEDLPPWSR